MRTCSGTVEAVVGDMERMDSCARVRPMSALDVKATRAVGDPTAVNILLPMSKPTEVM